MYSTVCTKSTVHADIKYTSSENVCTVSRKIQNNNLID